MSDHNQSEGIETVVNISGKYYRAIIPHPEDFTLERPILAIWPGELTEAEATRLTEMQNDERRAEGQGSPSRGAIPQVRD